MLNFVPKKYIYSSIILFIIFPSVSLFQVLASTHNSNPIRLELFDDTPEIDLSELPEIDYASLNAKWYDSKIEMLIITPNSQDFINASIPLMEWKNEKGIKTIILSNFSQYSGTDNAEKIRNMIISYYESENIQWVLLAGAAEASLIPIRYVYNNDVQVVDPPQSEHSSWSDTLKPTDFYYSDLTGSWDNDDDSKWGESAIHNSDGKDEIDWSPDVYVGRLPADNANELEIMVNKSIKYETNPNIGNWMTRMLLAGSVSSKSPPEDEARLTEYIWKNYVLGEMNFTHLHSTWDFTPISPPAPNQEAILDEDNFETELNNGYSTIIFAGHGLPSKYNDVVVTDVYLLSEAASSSNTDMPSLIYADACTTSSYDKNSESNIGETLIKRPNSGAIGYIGGLRVTWYFEYDTDLLKLNRGCAKLFWKEFFEEKKYQQGKALYDSKVAYMNSDHFRQGTGRMYHEWERKNVLTYCLLGDPELDIYTQKPKEAIDPFTEDIYEGQLVSITVKNTQDMPVSYARVHLKTNDGKYRTVYGNRLGKVEFRIPAQANETYNVTITGHNLIPSYFNFTTLSDEVKPEFHDVEYNPKDPSVSDNVCFDVETYDNYSGIESAFVLISDNDFDDFTYYKLSNSSQENERIFECEINKLDPGEYSFLFVARDYANNIEIHYQKSFKIIIPKPLMDYFLVGAAILIIAIAGISVVVAFFGYKKYEETFKRMEDI